MIAVVVLLLGQIRPDTVMDDRLHDAMFYRWVQEAANQADQWARLKPSELFSDTELVRTGYHNPYLANQLWKRKEYAGKVLKICAYRQVMKAYDLSEKEFQRILRDTRVSTIQFREEKGQWRKDNAPIQMARYPWSFTYTRFDPNQVEVPPKTAKLIRYKNPEKPSSKRPEMFSDEARGVKNSLPESRIAR